MEKFITVKTFTYQNELSIILGRLESEGIECFVKDEFAVQVTSFYSNAIGGIKLQVRESDLEKAIEIMKEGGYLNDKDYTALAGYNKNIVEEDIPQKHWSQEYKGLIIAAIIIAVLFIIYYQITGSMTDE